MALTAQEVKRALILPERFIGGHCQIQDGDGGPAIPFELWEFQVEVIHAIQDHGRLIFLKARQLGLSWLTLAYILWLCACNEGQTVLILNRGLRESVELLERIKFMHKRLPPELRPRIIKESGEQIHFANGSRIYSLTAGEYTGSGLTAQFVMVDEWSKIRGIRKILVSLLPTLAAGGTLVGIATAVGFHNAFAEEWRKAISGNSSYYPLFIPWHAHPKRDDAWYEQKRLEMPTERDLHQEYPCLTAETLVSTERGILPIAHAADCVSTESGVITAWSEQPPSEIWKLTTTQGRVLRGTGWHPVHTPTGFIRLDELRAGTAITLRPPMFAVAPYRQRVQKLPGTHIEIDEDWGRFLGYFAGDGSIGAAETISIACDGKDADVAEDVRRLLTDLVGEPSERRIQHGPVSSRRGDGGALELRVGRQGIGPLLAQLGAAEHYAQRGGYKRRICVPACIWRSPQPVVREFLRGLFEADGSASGRQVRFGAKNLEFVREVQLLLLGFGINARIAPVQRKVTGGREYTFHNFTLPMEATLLFHEQIGFVGQRKRAGRPTPGARSRVPNEMLDEVAAVTLDGVEATYDLTVQPNHVFSANGILTHNTEWLDAFQLPGESVFREEFDRTEHVLHEMPDPEANWPNVRGIDFGYHHGIVLWAEVQANRDVFVYSELHAERTTTRTMMQDALARDIELNVDTTATPAGCDPAGKAQTSVATESDHFTVQSFGIRVMSAEVAPKDRVQQIKQLLKEGRLHIHASCEFLIEALEQAQWAKSNAPQGSQSTDPILKETYEKDGSYEHPLDCLGYMLINVFPVYGKPAGASGQDRRARAPKKGRYSESEFG